MKIAFFEEQYIPFLKLHGIECQRSHHNNVMNMHSGNNYHGGHASNMYAGNMYNHQRENYFPSGHEPGGAGNGAFDEENDDDVNGVHAGVRRQNSRDAGLYDDDDINNDDDEILEGAAGGAGVADISDVHAIAQGVLEEDDDNDAQMEIQDNDDDDDDIDEIM